MPWDHSFSSSYLGFSAASAKAEKVSSNLLSSCNSHFPGPISRGSPSSSNPVLSWHCKDRKQHSETALRVLDPTPRMQPVTALVMQFMFKQHRNGITKLVSLIIFSISLLRALVLGLSAQFFPSMVPEVKSQPRVPSCWHLDVKPAQTVCALKESLQTHKVKTGENLINHLPQVCKHLIISHFFALMLMKARLNFVFYLQSRAESSNPAVLHK